MVVHGDEGLACSHVPDNDQVITAWRKRRLSEYTHTQAAGFEFELGVQPAVSSMLRVVGCQLTMPTRLECPSRTTMASEMGRVSV